MRSLDKNDGGMEFESAKYALIFCGDRSYNPWMNHGITGRFAHMTMIYRKGLCITMTGTAQEYGYLYYSLFTRIIALLTGCLRGFYTQSTAPITITTN